ncbi:alanine--tRNA ligase, partial [Candidatus Bipolaricaulota bacterium]|nr:alanine--tRNA ligase [Candidatus Bipolaricaulota bacterium]
MEWTTDELRESYLEYFEDKDHERKEGSGLIPDDPSMLFTSAGMVQFKDIFWGKREPELDRVTTCQKCFRANDIERVGETWYHHTFFEMLGNFSFGDYFKKGAIELAWEFVTDVLKFDEERLWVSVYQEDTEAYDIWKHEIGLPEEKITKLGKDENWWGPVGDAGPCGPDSEIFFDAGEEYSCGPDCDGVACDCNRFNELWNLVFTGYQMDTNGEVKELKRQNIDTGMGLERVAAVLQGVDSDFEIDIFQPIIDELKSIVGLNSYSPEQEGYINRIADHVRGAAFLISEGVIPANEGRGYVLRRIIRRAVQAGDRLGMKETFLTSALPPIQETMGGTYSELVERRDLIENVIEHEEGAYRKTLNEGEQLFYRLASNLKEKSQSVIPGEEAFRLYDTHGLPLSFLEELAEGEDLSVDKQGFEREMEQQRARSRDGSEEEDGAFGVPDVPETKFSGYEKDREEGELLALIKDGEEVSQLTEEEEGFAVIDQTPFYAEAGGQVSDVGSLENNQAEALVRKVEERKGQYYHQILVQSGSLNVGDKVVAKIDRDKRRATERNHTATHLLHQALNQVLGPHVVQSGSKVSPEELRFDFNHFEIPTEEERQEIENIVNDVILSNRNVTVNWVDSIEEARELGASAHFEEEYRGKEKLRTITVEDFSKELCGGTHVDQTGEIGGFAIKSMETIASGIRRIRAFTGKNFLADYRTQRKRLSKLADLAGSGKSELVNRFQSILSQQESLREELERKTDRLLATIKEQLLGAIKTYGEVKVIAANPNVDSSDLKRLADYVEAEIDGVVILGATEEDSASIVCKVSDSLSDRLNAGEIVREASAVLGGGGGGSAGFAQGGGPKKDSMQEALQTGVNL